jgi:ABC-type polysaccharide/polyol phosphate export permease
MQRLRELWAYRTLISNLAQRELRAKYKKSILGWAWSLISPAASLGIYTLVFGVYLRATPPEMGNGDSIFALYLFAALIMWNAFSQVLTGSMTALVGAGSLLSKIYFPPESPVIAGMLASLLQVAIESAILIAVMAVLGNISWTFIWVPVLVLQAMALGLGLGMVASLYNVIFRDVGYLISIAMQLLFYGTPIVYGLADIPEEVAGIPVRTIVSASPLTQLVVQSRDVLYLLEFPSLNQILYLTGWAVAVLALGWWIFTRRAADVIEEI